MNVTKTLSSLAFVILLGTQNLVASTSIGPGNPGAKRAPSVEKIDVPIACGDAALFSLPVSSPSSSLWLGMPSSEGRELATYQYYGGLDEAVAAVNWWGILAEGIESPSACDTFPASFEINFYADDGGIPGALTTTRSVSPQVQHAGLTYLIWPLYGFYAELNPVVNQNAGWISIRSIGDPTCWFFWMSSDLGDGLALTENEEGEGELAEQFTDASMCLSGVAGPGDFHTADQNRDGRIGLSELLRLVQFYTVGGHACDAAGEDGYAPGSGVQTCTAHDSDYSPPDWQISLPELLRLVQLFNSSAYTACVEGEDGFCPVE